jgi:hypothetical protein
MTTARETVETTLTQIRNATNVPEMAATLAKITEVDSLNDLSSDRPGLYSDRRILIAIDETGASHSVDLAEVLDYKTELLIRQTHEVKDSPTPRRTGRPAVGPKIQIRIPDSDLDALGERAAQLGMDRSELIRRYVASGLATEPDATMQTWKAVHFISADKRQMDIKGLSLVEAIEANFRTIMTRVGGLACYSVTEAIVTPDQGTVGGKPCATLRVTYRQNTGLPEHDSKPERTVAITIIGSLATLPETYHFRLNA